MNLYLLLGVPREARADEIRRAYRRLARKYHPGINPGDRAAAERFAEIALAFETLNDPDRRRTYDAQGDDAPRAAVSTFQFQGFDFSAEPPAADRHSTFGDLFGDALTERLAAGAAPPEQGADLYVEVSVPFTDALLGAQCQVRVNRLERCAPCDGRGRTEGPETQCVHCGGVGHVRMARGHMVFARPCGVCGGAGVQHFYVCHACGGEGVGVHSGTLSLTLPPGVSDGADLVFPSEGHAGRRAGPPGALHVKVRVPPHPYFRRVDDDVVVEVPVGVHEAALGARIEVPTPDGLMRMRVPPGTQSGQTFRFRDRGVPLGDRRGHLVVVVRLVLPALLDEASRELMREFAARNPGNVRETWLRGVTSPGGDVPAETAARFEE
ncbi:MAG: DnaJ C-terminal domain-containing protein [Vicinamibacterales bacterium]